MPQDNKETTKSLEESLDLVPLDPKWNYERSSPYGRCLAEYVSTTAVFERGQLVTVTKDGEVLFSEFVPNEVIADGKEEAT